VLSRGGFPHRPKPDQKWLQYRLSGWQPTQPVVNLAVCYAGQRSKTMDTDAAARAIVSAWDEDRHMPAEWMGRLTFDQGYAVQLCLLRHVLDRGERLAGWKVGLTAAAVRAQFGASEPVFGFLLESGERPSGHAFRISDLKTPGFENELCLFVTERLQGPGMDLAKVRDSVTAVAPALEIVENRGPAASDLPLAAADNAQQKAFVVGKKVALDDTNRDLAAARVSVHVNGKLSEEAAGSEVMGEGPLHSVLWLANKLAQFDLAVEPGSRIMAGSFTKQYRPSAGDSVEARFVPFGTVSARFD
jgi:2-keto-4-pentenoate hydratase